MSQPNLLDATIQGIQGRFYRSLTGKPMPGTTEARQQDQSNQIQFEAGQNVLRRLRASNPKLTPEQEREGLLDFYRRQGNINAEAQERLVGRLVGVKDQLTRIEDDSFVTRNTILGDQVRKTDDNRTENLGRLDTVRTANLNSATDNYSDKVLSRVFEAQGGYQKAELAAREALSNQLFGLESQKLAHLIDQEKREMAMLEAQNSGVPGFLRNVLAPVAGIIAPFIG